MIDTFLLLTGIIQTYARVLFITHLLIAALCITVLCLAIFDVLVYKKRVLLGTFFGMTTMFIADFVSFFMFYKGDTQYVHIFALGFFIFILLLSVDALRQALVVLQEASVSKANRHKAERATNTLMISQIGTHFFYHVLSSTRVLIKTNPDEAYSMLGNFSQYLRYNTDSSAQLQGLVPFRSELKAV